MYRTNRDHDRTDLTITLGEWKAGARKSDHGRALPPPSAGKRQDFQVRTAPQETCGGRTGGGGSGGRLRGNGGGGGRGRCRGRGGRGGGGRGDEGVLDEERKEEDTPHDSYGEGEVRGDGEAGGGGRVYSPSFYVWPSSIDPRTPACRDGAGRVFTDRVDIACTKREVPGGLFGESRERWGGEGGGGGFCCCVFGLVLCYLV